MKLINLLMLLFIGVILLGCEEIIEQDGLTRYQEDYYNVFDTRISITVWLDDQDEDALFDEIDEILTHGHKVSTRYTAYENIHNVTYINEHPDEIIDIDPLLTEMLALSLDIHENQSSLFNIALGEVVDVWTHYRDQCTKGEKEDRVCEVPSVDELNEAAEVADPSLIELDEENNTVMIPEGMTLDLGAVAKGVVAEKVGDYLRAQDVEIFMVNAGDSNIELEGTNPHPDRDYWSVGLKDPDNPLSRYGRIRVPSGYSAVTSGDYERFYTVDDTQYHHLISPETLFPTFYTRTVTVISQDPGLADIYSTIAFLMPVEDAIDFIDSIEDTEAIWLDTNREVRFSENFEDAYLLEILIEQYPD
ncbi:MAG: FAD:protein FMN transferase [Bacillota bacterium]